jgi:hypothetical protein
VPADRPWTDTGLTVAPGQEISITAEGQISATPGISSGPDGVPGRAQDPMAVLPGANYAALIARIGDNGAPFLVGAEGTHRSDAAGPLQLGINDQYHPDNTGRCIARVRLGR